jgi:YD repeat-containing protein
VTPYSHNVLDEEIAMTEPLSHTTSRRYDAVDNELPPTDPSGKEITSTNFYDLLHLQIATFDLLGETTSMVYNGDGNHVATIDANGTVIRMLRPDGSLMAGEWDEFTQR